jgi:hypothetical protein
MKKKREIAKFSTKKKEKKRRNLRPPVRLNYENEQYWRRANE